MSTELYRSQSDTRPLSRDPHLSPGTARDGMTLRMDKKIRILTNEDSSFRLKTTPRNNQRTYRQRKKRPSEMRILSPGSARGGVSSDGVTHGQKPNFEKCRLKTTLRNHPAKQPAYTCIVSARSFWPRVERWSNSSLPHLSNRRNEVCGM